VTFGKCLHKSLKMTHLFLICMCVNASICVCVYIYIYIYIYLIWHISLARMFIIKYLILS
jgi:hypothetical protein